MREKVKLKANVLKEFLARRNLTQNGFALRVGTTSGHLSQILSGQRIPRPGTRERILNEVQKLQRFRKEEEYQFDDLFSLGR
jgi:transcriptional regulator with XRE-family HTH domain